MSTFQLYRLKFSDPLQFYEQMGDPVTSTGGAPVPALRSALRHTVSVSTLAPNISEDTPATRLKIRRQFRSLANNTPMKLQGLYLAWDTDPENNGWYMPDQGQLVDLEGSIGVATGVFKIDNFVWIVAGRPRTHRRARWVYLKDLRTGEWSRDLKRLIYSTEFSGLAALALTYLPPGLSDAVTTGGIATVPAALPEGEDKGSSYVVQGLIDLARLSYEQAEGQITKGQVIVYDRRGEQTSPSTGPAAGWEEFYGPDYPYSWLEGAAIDTPVLDNGRCRVRWTTSGLFPGWAVDIWTGSAWVEQCKVIFGRKSGSNPLVTNLLSAALVEYSETRAVIAAVMNSPEDAQSREEVYITLQQGWAGPRFEIYTARNNAGEKVDAFSYIAVAATDTDDSAIKIDTANVGNIVSTATAPASHTGLFVTGTVGELLFHNENWVAIGRWGAPYGLTLAVLQSIMDVTAVAQVGSYGVSRNSIALEAVNKEGYLSFHLGFPVQQAQQALEAESMTLAAGTTSVVDSAASGGKAAQAKRKVEGLHVSQATWPNGASGTYRIFARVKATSGKLKVRAKTSSTTGAIVEATAAATPGYVWVDLGDVVGTGGTLEILAWQSVEVNFQVDRIEAFLTEDRNAAVHTWQGARDLGQAILYDSRAIPTIVSRTT